jgi:hypothetical protein
LLFSTVEGVLNLFPHPLYSALFKFRPISVTDLHLGGYRDCGIRFILP